MTGTPAVAYKILSEAQKDELLREGVFAGAPIDLAEGFVHLSTREQVADTLDVHFAGQTGVWIAAVDLSRLGKSVRWEASRAGQLFPHLYASLEASAVLACVPVEREPDGSVRLP